MSSDQYDPTEGHSPLPWDCTVCGDVVFDADAEWIASAATCADAALIVREVTEAPRLRAEVERLKALLDEVENEIIVEVWEGSSTVLVRRGELGRQVVPWQVHFHPGPHPDFADAQEASE